MTAKGRILARIHLTPYQLESYAKTTTTGTLMSQNDAMLGMPKGTHMLSYTITFLIIAIIAGVLGFVGIAGLAAEIAKILFIVFLVLFVVSLVAGRRPPV